MRVKILFHKRTQFQIPLKIPGTSKSCLSRRAVQCNNTIKKLCTVISKESICWYSDIHVYKTVKVIILDVKTSLLSLRSPCMPTQLILSYLQGFVILIKFYRVIILYNAMPTNASFLYDCTPTTHCKRDLSSLIEFCVRVFTVEIRARILYKPLQSNAPHSVDAFAKLDQE